LGFAAALEQSLIGGMERSMEHSQPITALNAPDKVNILVVDDQPAKLLSYEVILAKIGGALIKASSACEAFECLLKNDIALILIDVCMPDIDGFELAALIREHPRFQRIAIIFVSAIMTGDLHRIRGYELGALDYVSVPVVPELLQAKVKVFLDLYRKTRKLERFNAELEQQVLDRTAELRRRNEELERRIEAQMGERESMLAQSFVAQQRDMFGQLAGVTHDFNNLLMAVLGSLALLEKHLPEDLQSRQLLQNATAGARRGAVLTRGLLAFSRRQEPKPRSVDVGELLNGLKGLLQHALGVGIELDCRFPRGLPPVFMDANQLELALLNVALNAQAAMPDGGTVTISASAETHSTDTQASSLPSGDYVRLQVLHGATQESFTPEGAARTGLGLSVVRGIATQSGGVMCVDNSPDVGTTIELWLPRTNGRPPGPRADDRRPSTCLNGP
jgi:signal transduction histidine kinase